MTQAEQVKHEFETAEKTVSIATIAKRFGADIDDQEDEPFRFTRFYHFNDKSWLATKGRGKSYQYWTNAS